MISEGKHKARGIEAALGYTSKGTEQIAVLLETEHGEITWYGYFSEKTADRTLESLRYLGWEGDDLSDLSGISANEVTIVVEHEADEDGRTHPRVRWINRAGGLAMKEAMDEKATRAFAARMKNAARASRAKVGAAVPSAPSGGQRTQSGRSQWGEAPPHGDDDIDGIPF